MSRKHYVAAFCVLALMAWRWHFAARGVDAAQVAKGNPAAPAELEKRITAEVKPFLESYCFRCHGPKKQEGTLNLSHALTLTGLAGDARKWDLVLDRLKAHEMPPDGARQPEAKERAAVIAAISYIRDQEAERNAGDPGNVLARRLSNAEYDYTIRDLTGVDIRPTREFPVDPANQEGFDNSGESLTMSPALLKKYMAAARLVADHVVLKPEGFVFAPHPVVTDSDRDKYCVRRILEFYERHKVDVADYFVAAHRFRNREKLGRAAATLGDFALESRLSPKYLATVWSVLTEPESDLGPLAAIRKTWKELPDDAKESRKACERLRDHVLRLRAQLKPAIETVQAPAISGTSQSFVLWRNHQVASKRRSYDGNVFADLPKLAGELSKNYLNLDELFPTAPTANASEEQLRAAMERFCAVFPDTFVVTHRGRGADANEAKQRPLSAGFHLMQGFFRDDKPLCELVLSESERRELDELWRELDFITLAPMRQYYDFIFFERAEPPRFMFEAEFDFARSEDKDAISEEKMQRLAKVYLAKARTRKAGPTALKAIEKQFADLSASIRAALRARLAAEPSHLEALFQFAGRAYRRPLTLGERAQLLAFYRALRDQEQLCHEDALGDTLVSVLMSPHFCFRAERAPAGEGGLKSPTAKIGAHDVQPLSDYELASRLSYFLWASMPDAELLTHAAAGDLHKPEILTREARRLLKDPRVRGLATEFGGNWLDIRRFEEHNAVDRERFPAFTNALRQAMFEEPIRYLMDVAQRNRSVLDLLYGSDTFVNPELAKHYGIPGLSPEPNGSNWIHVEDARSYGRGGLLPMAVFLTKNAPGLRTSPVKRGYWVVRRVLGENIPPPPPTVPELPTDEAKTGELTLAQLMARHRDDKSCAGCHRRFDAVGLVFENYGPIGERRAVDLGGRPVQTDAVFPDGVERGGLDGLRAYLRERRQEDFVDNLCKKLYTFALGRSLLISDKKALDQMRKRLAAEGYAFGSLVEAIVTSPQFMTKRVHGASAD